MLATDPWWPSLNTSAQHPVVERDDAARVLALDRAEDPVDVGVRADPDALDALVGVEDQYVHAVCGSALLTSLTSPITRPQSCWVIRLR